MIQIIYKFILEAEKVDWVKGMYYRRAPEFSSQHPCWVVFTFKHTCTCVYIHTDVYIIKNNKNLLRENIKYIGRNTPNSLCVFLCLHVPSQYGLGFSQHRRRKKLPFFLRSRLKNLEFNFSFISFSQSNCKTSPDLEGEGAHLPALLSHLF